MTTHRLIRSAPYFVVIDVVASAAYYANTYGFETEYIAGSPAEFAMCARDGFAVRLRRVTNPDLIRPIETQGGTWDAFSWVDEAEALYDELVTRGARIVYGPVRQESYHMVEFAMRDADGHVLGLRAPTVASARLRIGDSLITLHMIMCGMMCRWQPTSRSMSAS